MAVLEPASSPRIYSGETETHHIEGIWIGIISPLLDEKLYDHAWATEEEARAMYVSATCSRIHDTHPASKPKALEGEPIH